MNRDIGRVIDELRRMFPGIACEQLHVSHPGTDDNGLCFFTHPDRQGEVQLESSSGNLPFLVEGDDCDVRDRADSNDEAVSLVARRLGLRTSTTG
jgi:hypothetical protein